MRFGKSLLISTFIELFKGNKQLFEGLYIYYKWNWTETNSVIHLDFSKIQYSTVNELKFSLNKFVEMTAAANKVEIDKELLLSMKFAQLIEKLEEKTREQVVILVDEYDKPLIDNFSNKEVCTQVKRVLHDFYQVIKANVKHERFVFLTGISQFSGLSIFSGLNNLIDITMNSKYASICGCTQEKLENNFKDHIEYTSQIMKIPKKELLIAIKTGITGIHGMERHLYIIHFQRCCFSVIKSLVNIGLEPEHQHF